MKQYFIAILLLLSSVSAVFAQDEDSKNWEKIKAIKVGFITDKVHLTSEQSTKFWPVYDGYQAERRNIRKELITKYMSGHPDATKSQARAYLDADLDYQERELDLKRKYKDRLLQVISQQQLTQLYEAEREFRKLLLDQLRNGSSGK